MFDMSDIWQLYALGAIFATCVENITDKAGIRAPIDTLVATFIRVATYSVLVPTLCFIFGQPLTFYVSPGIVVFGVASTAMASVYTLTIKKVDVTTFSLLSYIGPLCFLAIDNVIGSGINLYQSLGVCGLVLGGMLFLSNGTLKLDKITISALLFLVTFSGSEAYYLKYLVLTENISGISVLASIWVWAALFLGCAVIAKGKLPLIFDNRTVTYVKYSATAKTFDATSSILTGVALTQTTVSQFSALDVFFPPMMLMLAIAAQKWLKIDLGESIDKKTVSKKGLATVVLIISGLMV